jgi:predicted cupin superfamily sugar epimerase
METKEFWIEKLNLKSHPEGGYYNEIYASKERITSIDLTHKFQGTRSLATSIFYLLDSESVSKFHKLQSDEIWYYHHGATLHVYTIDNQDILNHYKLGSNAKEGEIFQLILPAGIIFAAEVIDKEAFSIFGCMVTPGFTFEDFELLVREDMLHVYPEYEEIIKRLT